MRKVLLLLAMAFLISLPNTAQSDEESEECRDARSTAQISADDLAVVARKLQICAESGDLTYDCYTEFRRVKRAHEDFEIAVADVSSECD